MSAAEDHTGAQCDDVEGDDYSTAVALVVTITAMALAVMTARVNYLTPGYSNNSLCPASPSPLILASSPPSKPAITTTACHAARSTCRKCCFTRTGGIGVDR